VTFPRAALADYNRRVDQVQRAALDYICWQDYAWSSDIIRDGADAVSRMLAANGLAADTRKMLVGSGWLLHNILAELKDPRERRFTRARESPIPSR
jgi:hypothetical protein